MPEQWIDDPVSDGTQPLPPERLFDDPLAGLITGEGAAVDQGVSVNRPSTTDDSVAERGRQAPARPPAEMPPPPGAPISAPPPSGKPIAAPPPVPRPQAAPQPSWPTNPPAPRPRVAPQQAWPTTRPGTAPQYPQGSPYPPPPAYPSPPAQPPRPRAGTPRAQGFSRKALPGCIVTIVIIVIVIVRIISSIIDAFH